MRKVVGGVACAVALALSGVAAAQDARNGGEGGGGNPAPGRNGSDDFFGKINWGAGLGFVLDLEGKEKVGEAEVVNGIVRIRDENDGSAGLMLETHYFFHPGHGADNTEPGWGVGPFVAVQLGNDELIQTVALGIMFGVRRHERSASSFNIGFGLAVDPDAQVLGDGLVANEPLPVGETGIRYKEEAQYGFLIVTSFSF